ncbi:hypothetical protein D3C85_738160 [compost metagenome]
MNEYFEPLGEVKHLSEPEIEVLYQRYLAGEKTSHLIAEYKIPGAVRSLLRVLPPLLSKELKCPYCDLPMWVKRHARGTPESLRPPFQCVRCEHRVYPHGPYSRHMACSCTTCYKVRQQALSAQAQRDRDELVRQYGVCREPVPYATLSFVQKLTLLAVLDAGKPGTDSIAPLDASTRNEALAPSEAISEDLLKKFHEAGVLRVDPESDIHAFERAAGCRIRNFLAVRWLPNVALEAGECSTRDALYRALYQELSGRVQPAWKSELYNLMFNLAREESLAYIRVLASEVNFVFGAENRAESVVGQLLQDFSVSEIYYFARIAVKNAAHFYATGNSKGRNHASNTIPGNMLSTAQSALADNWRKSAYRDPRVAQSALHRLLYDVVLKDSGAGFSKSPGVYWREELVPRFFSAPGFGAGTSPSVKVFCRECDSGNIDVRMDKVSLDTLCYDCGTVSQFQAIHDVSD